MENNLPFSEIIQEGYHIREFSDETDPKEFVWHRDREDRIVYPTHLTDWLFQMDNELPRIIESEIFIPKGVYHRIIKGSGKLVLKIKKF